MKIHTRSSGNFFAHVCPPGTQCQSVYCFKEVISLNSFSNIEFISFNSYFKSQAAIAEAFPELKSVYLALPIECFREIAEKLPTTKAELLEIDQMTHFRFERFGPHLLEVCQDFNAKRMNYLEDKQLAEMMAKAEEAKVFNTPSSNNPIYKNDTQRYVTQVFTLKIKIEFTVRYTRQITALIFFAIIIFTKICIKIHALGSIFLPFIMCNER